MKIDRCTVCATTIYDGDDEVCRHGWRTCLACDPRDACDECNTEWVEQARPRCLTCDDYGLTDELEPCPACRAAREHGEGAA